MGHSAVTVNRKRNYKVLSITH